MRKVLFILFFTIPIFAFSQADQVKLLRVNGSNDYPLLQLGNFTFTGNTMLISGDPVFYRVVDSTKFNLYTVFSEGLRLGNTTTTTEGTMRYTGTDIEGYIGGEWKSLSQAGSSSVYEEELVTPKIVYDVGFILQSTSLVFFNGTALKNSQWSGEGSSTLTLSFPTDQYDNIIVKQ